MSSVPAAPGLPGLQPRPGQPAFYSPERRAWQVFRYESVQRVLSDFAVFSSNRGGRLDPSDPGTSLETITNQDPPRHRQMRGLLNQVFTPRTVARLEPAIRRQTDELLDEVVDRGAADVVEALAVPLPLMVIAELLGVPEADQRRMRQLSDSSAEFNSQASAGARETIMRYFMTLAAQRRQEPRDDLISALVASEIDGVPLTDAEVVAYAATLLVAGNETTRNLIGSAALCLGLLPEVQTALRADPGLLPDAIEEVLRYVPPVAQFPRIATQDTAIDGQTVRAGEWVMPWIESANRDPEVFSDPEVFDMRRQPNRHLSFGYGAHFCMGAALARLEARIALERLLARTSEWRLQPGQTPEPHRRVIGFGYRHVPIVFARAPAG